MIKNNKIRFIWINKYILYIAVYMIKIQIPYLFEYNMHLCIAHTKLSIGIFGTKCCTLYSNEYGILTQLKQVGDLKWN